MPALLPRLELKIKAIQQPRNNKAHFRKCEILTDAVPRAEAKGLKHSVVIILEALFV